MIDIEKQFAGTGMSPAHFARLLGLHRTTTQYWKREGLPKNVVVILRLCKAIRMHNPKLNVERMIISAVEIHAKEGEK